MVKGGVDDGIGIRSFSSQSCPVFQITRHGLRPGEHQLAGALLRSRQSDDLMAGADEIVHDSRADELGRAGQKNARDASSQDRTGS